MQPVATNLFKVHSLLIPTSLLLLEPGQINLKPQLWGHVAHLKSQGESITQQSPAFQASGPPTLTPGLCLPVLLPGPRFTIPHSLPSPWLLLTALSSWNACPSTFQSVFIWPGPSRFTCEGSSHRTYPDSSSLLWMPFRHNIWCMKFFIMFWHSASYYSCFTSPQDNGFSWK